MIEMRYKHGVVRCTSTRTTEIETGTAPQATLVVATWKNIHIFFVRVAYNYLVLKLCNSATPPPHRRRRVCRTYR